MILALQSNIPGRLHVWLFNLRGQIVNQAARGIGPGQTYYLLNLVAKVLGRKKNTIKQIVVVRGPGPFTPVRTGFVVAQTLSQIWGVPASGVVADHELSQAEWQKILTSQSIQRQTDDQFQPYYGRAPNISRPRTRKRAAPRPAGRGRGRTALK